MNIARLSWGYLSAKPLSTILNVVLFTFGIAIIIVLILFTRQLEEKLSKNAEGIELVVGAKGSPLQIILCSIFHIDFPTGNISLLEAEQLMRNRQIKLGIPMALGDSYQGFRIVGTTTDYLDLYEARYQDGRVWEDDLEVVIGSNVARELGVKTDDHFSSQHGLDEEGYGHEGHEFMVKGVLEPNGSVLDNLILTTVPSIWKVHEKEGDNEDHEDEGDHSNEEDEDDHEDHDDENEESARKNDEEIEVTSTEEAPEAMSQLIPGVDLNNIDSTTQITSLLIQFRSPMGAVMLPRMINQNTNMQAASPAFESARLFSIVGVGVDVVQGFAIIIVIIAALSIFIALFNSLKERKYDLAIMRSMGATQSQLFRSILLEGIMLTLLGSLFGFLLGHLSVELINNAVPASEQSGIDGGVFYFEEFYVFAGGVAVGIIAALIPALQAMRADISRILARG